jgi:hypothetical protein
MRTTGAARVIDTAAPPLPRCEVGWDLEGNGNGTERGEAVLHTSRRPQLECPHAPPVRRQQSS